MRRDDLIALDLHTPGSSSLSRRSPASAARAGSPVEQVLTLLHDLIAVVELSDDGALHRSVDDCRKVVAASTDAAAIQAAVATCTQACGQALATIDRQRVDQKREISALLEMVHEALAIVSGDGDSFNRHLGHAADRFEALARVDDVRQLKAELVREVSTLREIVVERQKAFEGTLQNFNHRVQLLERQLTMTREEATLDPLTRVANRGGFDHTCREWLGTDRPRFVLAIVDVDDFKQINDVHGHAFGDRALTLVAQTLKNSARQERDVVARIGGDEFAVLISDLSLPQAESRMRLLSTSLAAGNLATPARVPLTVTLSCGLAERSAGDTVESLMERADRALYDAKHLGKNRVVGHAKPTLRELRQH